MDTLELIELVTKNHKAVVEHHTKTEKALEHLPDLEARMTDVEQKLARRGGGAPAFETKSWGNTIIESDAFKEFCGVRGRKTSGAIELKMVSVIGSGATLAGPMIAPQIITDPVILPCRRMTIRNLLAPGQTNSNAVWFPRMTARQNNSSVVAEQALKPQSDVTMALVSTPVVTIAHIIKAAKQALDDAPSLASLIDSELRYGLSFTEETELLLGDGTGAHLLGLIPQATAYSAAFAVTGETAIDRIALAILQSELSLLPATGCVVNPTDWMKMKMLKDATGKYILGNPNDQTAPFLWGLPVVPTTAMASGQFMVGSFEAAAQIFDRQNVIVELSTENNDDFEKNKVSVRCEERLALAVKQPLALITGTLP